MKNRTSEISLSSSIKSSVIIPVCCLHWMCHISSTKPLYGSAFLHFTPNEHHTNKKSLPLVSLRLCQRGVVFNSVESLFYNIWYFCLGLHHAVSLFCLQWLNSTQPRQIIWPAMQSKTCSQFKDCLHWFQTSALTEVFVEYACESVINENHPIVTLMCLTFWILLQGWF